MKYLWIAALVIGFLSNPFIANAWNQSSVHISFSSHGNSTVIVHRTEHYREVVHYERPVYYGSSRHIHRQEGRRYVNEHNHRHMRKVVVPITHRHHRRCGCRF